MGWVCQWIDCPICLQVVPLNCVLAIHCNRLTFLLQTLHLGFGLLLVVVDIRCAEILFAQKISEF